LQGIDRSKADPIVYVKGMLAQKKKVAWFWPPGFTTPKTAATHLRKMSHDLGESSGQRQWYDMSEKIEQFVKAEKKLNAETSTSTPLPPTTPWDRSRPVHPDIRGLAH